MRQLSSQLGVLLMLAVCGAALRWGERAERRVGVLLATAWACTLLVQRLTGQVAPVGWLASMDAGVFLALLALSWDERAGWMVYAVGCQGVALGVHVIRLLAPAMTTWTYLTALAAASYALLFTLAWGVWSRRQAMGSRS